ncbi:MAG: dihydropyrimidinase, partial [Pseudomonadota bacterium]
RLEDGMDADIVIWDPEREHTYGANGLHDNVGYNPWEDHSVTGWPEQVILRGRTLMNNRVFHGRPGEGKWIDRPTLATQPTQKRQTG